MGLPFYNWISGWFLFSCRKSKFIGGMLVIGQIRYIRGHLNAFSVSFVDVAEKDFWSFYAKILF